MMGEPGRQELAEAAQLAGGRQQRTWLEDTPELRPWSCLCACMRVSAWLLGQSGGAPALRPGAVAQSPGREAALAWASLAQRFPASSVLAREGPEVPASTREEALFH